MDYPPGENVQVKTPFMTLSGRLTVPPNSRGVVLLPLDYARHEFFVRELLEDGFATLAVDLPGGNTLSGEAETSVPLASHVTAVTDWLAEQRATQGLRVGYAGTGESVGAMLAAAADRVERVGAVVSCGGMPNAAADSLARVEAPTLFIVGGDDAVMVQQNQEALALLRSKKQLEMVPDVFRIWDDDKALEAAVRLTVEWFRKYL